MSRGRGTVKPAAKPIAKHAPGARRAPFVLLLFGLVVGGMCALLALNTASAANEVQRHDLALKDQGIAAELVQLRNDQQASAAPGNLAAAAVALGMVPAGNPAFLEVAADGHVRVMGAPAAASYVPIPIPQPTKSKPAKSKEKDKAKKDKSKSDNKKSDKPKADKTKTDKTETDKTENKIDQNKDKHIKKSDAPQPTSTPSPTPTPTPTPESTLPGGTR